MIKPLVRKSSCSSSQDTISLYHAYRRRYCIIYIKGFRDYSFPFLLKIIAQPFSYPLTPRKHSPNVSCVTYTMTWTPGFSSNCTKFWFNALNSVSTICKTRERVHGQTWKVTALPYESTDKKKKPSSFIRCGHLYRLDAHILQSFMKPRSGKTERGMSKKKEQLSRDPHE